MLEGVKRFASVGVPDLADGIKTSSVSDVGDALQISHTRSHVRSKVGRAGGGKGRIGGYARLPDGTLVADEGADPGRM